MRSKLSRFISVLSAFFICMCIFAVPTQVSADTNTSGKWKHATVSNYGKHTYIDAKGKKTVYQLVNKKKDDNWLKVNGKKAKQKDISVRLSSEYSTICRFGDYYYVLYIDKKTGYVKYGDDSPSTLSAYNGIYEPVCKKTQVGIVYTNVVSGTKFFITIDDFDIYDIVTGKKVGVFRGTASTTYDYSSGKNKFIASVYGNFLDLTNKKIVYIKEGKRAIISDQKDVYIHDFTLKENNISYDSLIVFTNNSNKKIKYITFNISFKNTVDDPIYDDVTNKNLKSLRTTGPIESGETVVTSSENCFWTTQTVNATLYSVDIEYMDGTKKTLSGKDLAYNDFSY